MKKRKERKKSGRSRTYTHGFANQLLYHLHHHIPLLQIKSFILKVNHAQKHTTSNVMWLVGNLVPLDFQIFIRVKANIKEGNAQLCMYTEI
jgi:hypothetical protein